jgi:hypothetical protein
VTDNIQDMLLYDGQFIKVIKVFLYNNKKERVLLYWKKVDEIVKCGYDIKAIIPSGANTQVIVLQKDRYYKDDDSPPDAGAFY